MKNAILCVFAGPFFFVGVFLYVFVVLPLSGIWAGISLANEFIQD